MDFATYTKEGGSGLEYANQRHYSAGYGRFMTVDPYGGSAEADDPGSWNRYTYVEVDPINFNDASGEERAFVSCGWQTGDVVGEGGPGFAYLCTVVAWSGWNSGSGGDINSPFTRAVASVMKDLADLAKKKKWSKDCKMLFAALGTTGASVSDRASDGFQFENATTSVDLQSGLYSYSSDAASAASQFGAENVKDFVANYAAANPGSETKAETVLNPNNIVGENLIYLNPTDWGQKGNYFADRSTALHELLHSLTGDTDTDFGEYLGRRNASGRRWPLATTKWRTNVDSMGTSCSIYHYRY